MHRTKNILITLLFVLEILIFSGFSPVRLFAAASPANIETLTREELQNQKDEKAKQLEEINKQLETTTQTLKNVQGERKNLQRELNTLQNNINQLNLNTKKDELTIQRLRLEIEELGLDLEDIKNSMTAKRTAIGDVLRELQKNDHQNLLALFLQNDSLADSVLEAQALSNLQSQLTVDVSNLRTLQENYNQKLQTVVVKKTDTEFHQKNLTNRKLIVEDQKQERDQILKQTKNKENLYQQQVAELAKLQQQIANEVEALDAILRTKIDPRTLPAPRPGVLAMPTPGGKNDITQDYGATAFARYGYTGKWHNGIDIRAAIGTPIFAAEDGTVAAAGNQDAYCYRGAYGKFVVINHANNLTTLYAHLSRQIISKGDIVKRGQVIGYSGSTGYATGPHLHFTVYAQPTFYMGPSRVCGPMPHGGDLNPAGYL